MLKKINMVVITLHGNVINLKKIINIIIYNIVHIILSLS